jgi:hypothetical protein
MTRIDMRLDLDPAGLSQRAVRRACEAAVAEAAETLLTDTNPRVPLDEGPLAQSGRITHDPANLTSAVSYDTPYAVKQHEDTTLNHPQQGEAKFLERTMHERARTYGDTMAARVRKGFG